MNGSFRREIAMNFNRNEFCAHRAISDDDVSARSKLCRTSNQEFWEVSRSCKSGTLASTFMQEIPDEILDLLLAFAVRGHRDMRTLALTCKRWLVFARQEISWKRLALRGWGNRSDIIQISIEKNPDVSWYAYYKSRILSHLPNLCYLRSQQHMTVSIRSILVNWLLAVIDEFQQDEETVYLPSVHHQTVALFDNFCSRVKGTIQTSELQMIGAACTVLALNAGNQLNNIQSAFFETASFYTDGACTAEQIAEISNKISDILQLRSLPAFETAFDSIDSMLTGMQKNYPSSSTFCLSHYLGELALQAEASLKYTPAVVGIAAYALACHTLGWSESIWMPIIRSRSSGALSLQQLKPCMSELQGLLRQALGMLTRRSRRGNLPHVIVKYSRRERQHVAKVIVTPTPWPITCPHGCSRENAESQCVLCGNEDSRQLNNHNFAPPQGETMSSANSHELNSEYEYYGDDILPNMDAADLSAIVEVEASREEVQTPVNPQHSIENTVDGSIFQRTLVKQGAPGMVPVFDSNASGGVTPSLQDVSFGAISDGNDNSFIIYPDSAFDEDHLLLPQSNDRRASLTLLDAVDEEESNMPRQSVIFGSIVGHSESKFMALSSHEDTCTIEKNKVFDAELRLEESTEDGQLLVSGPDLTKLTLQ